MRTLLMSFMILSLIASGCKKESETTKKSYYDYMRFSREGGGEINFNLYPTEATNKLKAVVSRYNYKDTSCQVLIEWTNNTSAAFSSFQKVMANESNIKGDFQQSTALTGTWSYIYFVTGTKETEVTNTTLRDSLLIFEQLVREKIEQ